MILTSLIIVSVICLLSLIANYVLYKRLVEFEDNNQEREDEIYEKIEEFKSVLKEKLQVIEEVAGLEIVSNEPFVKRVVQTVIDTHDAFTELQAKLNQFELDVPEDNDDENDDDDKESQ